MNTKTTILLSYSRFKILRNLFFGSFYLLVAYGILSFINNAIEKNGDIEFKVTEIFIVMVLCFSLLFGLYQFFKWLPCLFINSPALKIDETGITFKPNIGILTLPWYTKTKFISWSTIEEYWFHGAKVLGEQSMAFSAYALSFKIKDSKVPEIINLGPMSWSYPEVKSVIENYTQHAVIGGN